MSPSIPKLIIFLLLNITITLTHALQINSTLSTIQAGTEFTLKITNDLYKGSISSDSPYDTYRIYLLTSPVPNNLPESNPQPACYLNSSVPIATTEVKLTIPPTVGPPTHYRLALRAFKTPATDTVTLPLTLSAPFNLTSTTANSTWSASELNPNSLGGFDGGDHIPCSSLACARDCARDWKLDGGNDACVMEGTYECVAACPGVSKVAWATWKGMPNCTVSVTGGGAYGMSITVVDAQTVVEFWTTSGTMGGMATAVATSTAEASGPAKPNSGMGNGMGLGQIFGFSVIGMLAFILGAMF